MSIVIAKYCKLKYQFDILVMRNQNVRKEISMKNCKWLIFFLFLLLSAFIIFRYIQKRPSSEAEKMIPKETESIQKEIEAIQPEITYTQDTNQSN